MRFTQISFRAGADTDAPSLSFVPGKVTVFIGPNNGGKSLALSELQQAVDPPGFSESKVIESATTSPLETDELQRKLGFLDVPKEKGENASPDVKIFEHRGARVQVHMTSLMQGLADGARLEQYQYASQYFLRHFLLNLDGGNRLGLVNPAGGQNPQSRPNSTQATLFRDDSLRKKLSDVVKSAFSQYLVIDPTSMAQLHYRLSPTEPPVGIEKSLTSEAINYFSAAQLIHEASDGTKAFVGIMAEVLAGVHDILFVDEPEAFLHPALSFLLGNEICKNVSHDKQIFVATHSPNFLMGCILSGVDVDVVRLTYRSGAATARLLPAREIRQLMTDPLLRSVGVLSALFYESAVVVEGDSDRAFYQEINERLRANRCPNLNHTIFLNAHNKQTISNIVRPLRALGIPAAFIMDIDWLKEDGQVRSRYFSASGVPIVLRESFGTARQAIRNALHDVDTAYKRNGGVSLLAGAEKVAATAFFDQMEEYGLFTVRAGELESWLPCLGCERTKSKWLMEMFQRLGSDPESENYVKPESGDVWEFLGQISAWTRATSRRGMESA